MCNLTDNFYEDLFLDLQYQEYIYRKQQEKNQQYDEVFSIEQKAYDIQAEQYFKDLEEYNQSLLLKTI
jgi:hypothetical protein